MQTLEITNLKESSFISLLSNTFFGRCLFSTHTFSTVKQTNYKLSSEDKKMFLVCFLVFVVPRFLRLVKFIPVTNRPI
jgi:uncharacterized membrane protein (UPF0136 family)